MLGAKISGKMEALFTVQDITKDYDLPGEALKFGTSLIWKNILTKKVGM